MIESTKLINAAELYEIKRPIQHSRELQHNPAAKLARPAWSNLL
jgi:hypothetical protein